MPYIAIGRSLLKSQFCAPSIITSLKSAYMDAAFEKQFSLFTICQNSSSSRCCAFIRELNFSALSFSFLANPSSYFLVFSCNSFFILLTLSSLSKLRNIHMIRDAMAQPTAIAISVHLAKLTCCSPRAPRKHKVIGIRHAKFSQKDRHRLFILKLPFTT